MSEPVDESLRRRLVEIDDAMRGLASDDFVGRHELQTEADACRLRLAAAVGAQAAEAAKEWAERAGHKGSHEVDPEVAKALTITAVPGSLEA